MRYPMLIFGAVFRYISESHTLTAAMMTEVGRVFVRVLSLAICSRFCTLSIGCLAFCEGQVLQLRLFSAVTSTHALGRHGP